MLLDPVNPFLHVLDVGLQLPAKVRRGHFRSELPAAGLEIEGFPEAREMRGRRRCPNPPRPSTVVGLACLFGTADVELGIFGLGVRGYPVGRTLRRDGSRH